MSYETNPRLLRLCFWNYNGYPWNAGFGIDEFTNDLDITLVETCEHNTQSNEGLGNYNVYSLIWGKNPRQRRGQGGWHV